MEVRKFIPQQVVPLSFLKLSADQVENVAQDCNHFFQCEACFKQQGLSSTQTLLIDQETLIVSIPNDYIVKGALLQDIFDQKRGLNYCIFTPSSRRCAIGRLNYAHVMEGNTYLHVLVVKRVEFEDYRARWGSTHIIFSLPPEGDSAGIGYSRHWIVKIARYFDQQFIWMLDDSIHSFKEIIHKVSAIKTKNESKACSFFKVLSHISSFDGRAECIMLGTHRLSYTYIRITTPFLRTYVYSAVFLNVRRLLDEQLQYDKGDHVEEDIKLVDKCLVKNLISIKYLQFLQVKLQLRGGCDYMQQAPILDSLGA